MEQNDLKGAMLTGPLNGAMIIHEQSIEYEQEYEDD